MQRENDDNVQQSVEPATLVCSPENSRRLLQFGLETASSTGSTWPRSTGGCRRETDARFRVLC